MRKLILAATLLAASVAAHAASDVCLDEAGFLKAAAQSRDKGYPEQISLEAMRETYPPEIHATLAPLNHLAYTAVRGTPSQLYNEWLKACTRQGR